MTAPVTSPLPTLLTVPEVAAELRVSRSTVERMVKRGDLHAVKLGRRDGSTVRIRSDELARLLANERTERETARLPRPRRALPAPPVPAGSRGRGRD